VDSYGTNGNRTHRDQGNFRLRQGTRHHQARRARRDNLPAGVTEQGQAAEAVIEQVAASAFGVRSAGGVITGDTDNTPLWAAVTLASRAAA